MTTAPEILLGAAATGGDGTRTNASAGRRRTASPAVTSSTEPRSARPGWPPPRRSRASQAPRRWRPRTCSRSAAAAGLLPADVQRPVHRPAAPGDRTDTIKIDGRPEEAVADPLDQGRPRVCPRVEDTREKYDCVIVGAGASGLSAAKWYQDRFGPGQEDPDHRPAARLRRPLPPQRVPRAEAANGGADVMTLRNGGTVNLDRIGTWGQDARGRHPGLVRRSRGRHPRLGRRRLPRPRRSGRTAARRASRARSGCARCCSSPAAEFGGTDKVIQSRTEPNTAAGWTTFMARTPYSAAAKAAIIGIQTDTPPT